MINPLFLLKSPETYSRSVSPPLPQMRQESRHQSPPESPCSRVTPDASAVAVNNSLVVAVSAPPSSASFTAEIVSEAASAAQAVS